MSSSKKVVVTDYTFPNIDIEKSIISSNINADIVSFQCRNVDEVFDIARGADALLVQFAPITEKVIKCLKPEATIVRYGVGYDNIDIEAANKYNIKVGYVPDYCTDEVADHTVALLLSMLRNVYKLYETIKDGYWQGVNKSGNIKAFKKTNIGFLGLGRIGHAVLERLQPFGFNFLINDPNIEKETANKYGAELIELTELWERADVFTLHAPAIKETRNIINKRVLGAMKDSAIVINTARGELIDNSALAEALQTGEIAGAALDVFKTEPLPLDSIFLNTPNLLMTPHIAWFSNSSIARLQRLAAEEIVRGLKGEALRCPIN